MPELNCLPDWILEALKALRPPGKLTVSEWADKNRILDEKTSALPGRWRTNFTPYLKQIMDSFNDNEVEEIIIVKPTQTGGTEVILNMIGYAISLDPGSMMVVYPTDVLGESISLNRIQPMIELCPDIKEKYNPNSKRLELQFSGMYLAIAGSNSPSSLASRPCRFLFMDEVDKYPVQAGKEADPRSLARERTKTYDNNKKIVEVSTPTFEEGAIWQDYLSTDTKYEYFVSCPHCNAKWTFKFKQLKYESEDSSTAYDTALYICEECGGVIMDNQKTEMIRNGEWIADKVSSKKRIGFKFNTFLSPWVRFGDIASEFVRSKNAPELLQNFINSWLGEPYKQVESSMTAERILERCSKYENGEVPKNAVLLTGGVDVQKKSFYWIIRAWMPNMTSYNIAHGQAFTWQEIEYYLNYQYKDAYGKSYVVNLCCVDSGDQTDDVYNFCVKNSEWTIPVKGSSNRMLTKYKISIINKDSMKNGISLCIVDTDFYKDMIYSRLNRNENDGGWFIYNDCDVEYAEMIVAEHKIIKKVNGHLISKWEQKQTGNDNHFLDCEVYASVAADLCGLRTIVADNFKKHNITDDKKQNNVSIKQNNHVEIDNKKVIKSKGYFNSTRREKGGNELFRRAFKY